MGRQVAADASVPGRSSRLHLLHGQGRSRQDVDCLRNRGRARRAGGKRVLLVSTDPASNVGQVFDVSIGNTITPIGVLPGLSALEIDPEQAAEATESASSARCEGCCRRRRSRQLRSSCPDPVRRRWRRSTSSPPCSPMRRSPIDMTTYSSTPPHGTHHSPAPTSQMDRLPQCRQG